MGSAYSDLPWYDDDNNVIVISPDKKLAASLVAEVVTLRKKYGMANGFGRVVIHSGPRTARSRSWTGHDYTIIFLKQGPREQMSRSLWFELKPLWNIEDVPQ
jgi:hypothetical protein